MSGHQKELQLARLSGWEKRGRLFYPVSDTAESALGEMTRAIRDALSHILYSDTGHSSSRTVAQWLSRLGMPDDDAGRRALYRALRTLERRGDISRESEFFYTDEMGEHLADDEDADLIRARFSAKEYFVADEERRKEIRQEMARFFYDEYGWKYVHRKLRITAGDLACRRDVAKFLAARRAISDWVEAHAGEGEQRRDEIYDFEETTRAKASDVEGKSPI